MIKKLVSHLGEYKRAAVLTPLFAALEAVMDVLLPTIMAFIIDQGIEKGDMNAILKYGLLTFLVAVVALALGVLAGKYAAMGRIHFAHLRNVAVLDNGFEERAHLSCCGSLDMFGIVKALVENGFDGYVRPDHGRMIWGETGRAGYGLYDRALGATYLNGLFEAVEKMGK